MITVIYYNSFLSLQIKKLFIFDLTNPCVIMDRSGLEIENRIIHCILKETCQILFYKQAKHFPWF